MAFMMVLLVPCAAQQDYSYEQLSGICRVYPDVDQPVTAPPRGYKPFYISHLGRHGSRWQVSESVYSTPLEIMEKAASLGVLTPLGEEVLSDVRTVCSHAAGREGELTPRGEVEHRHIAERMYRHYPHVFKGKDRKVDVQSSARVRSLVSGVFASERLKELNPALEVSRCAAPVNWDSIFVLSASRAIGDSLKALGRRGSSRIALIAKPEPLVSRLFTDGSFLPEGERWKILYGLYLLAEDTKAAGLDSIDLFRALPKEEIFPLWEYENAMFYYRQCNSSEFGRYALSDGVRVLKRIIREGDAAIAGNGVAANLRYGHDQNVATLGALMGIKGCGEVPERDYSDIKNVFRDFETVPMACNIQLVFFRKKGSPVLVKVLLNEEEATLGCEPASWPFYRWDTLKEYFNAKINSQ